MHRQHCIGISSLAGYIGEAMDGLPICHAFIVLEKSFDIPAILFNLASNANKNKREDNYKVGTAVKYITVIKKGLTIFHGTEFVKVSFSGWSSCGFWYKKNCMAP